MFLTCLMATTVIAFGQFYKQKPFHTWSEKEAQRMLNDSPWAETYTFTDTGQQVWQPGANTGGVNEVNVNFRIRWLSARPVRQAFARLVLLQSRPDVDQASITTRLDAFVNRSFPDHIVVSVDYDTNDGRIAGEIAEMMKRLLTAELRNNTYLIKNKGDRAWLSEYQPPGPDGLGAQFVFPRNVEGKPFVTGEDKDIRFVTRLSGRYTLNIRFKLSDMMYEGQIEY